VKTYNEKQIWVAIKNNDTERVQPLPHLLCFLLPEKSFKLCGTFLVDRLGLQEETEDSGCSGESSLQPEDIAPATESDDDTADERT
jgi:hypothetical protein